MLESTLEKIVCKWVDDIGGKAVKLKIESEKGFPDRFFFMPPIQVGAVSLPVVLCVELKKPKTGAASAHQMRWVRILEDYFVPVFICSTLEEVQEKYHQVRDALVNSLIDLRNME